MTMPVKLRIKGGINTTSQNISIYAINQALNQKKKKKKKTEFGTHIACEVLNEKIYENNFPQIGGRRC